MTDIDAIRARDAAAIFTTFTDLTMYQQAIRDRRALLAEVDRLGTIIDLMPVPAQIVEDERARIRAAVEGLPSWPGYDGLAVSRAAVLAIVEGTDGPD